VIQQIVEIGTFA